MLVQSLVRSREAGGGSPGSITGPPWGSGSGPQVHSGSGPQAQVAPEEGESGEARGAIGQTAQGAVKGI